MSSPELTARLDATADQNGVNPTLLRQAAERIREQDEYIKLLKEERDHERTAKQAAQDAANETTERIRELEGERDDYRERLRDLVLIDSEEWATGGGPGFKERSAKAWSHAREPFEP